MGVTRLRVLPKRMFLARSGEGDAEVPRASSDHNKFLFRLRRHAAQRFFPSVIENQGNRFSKVGQALLARFALAVRTGHFGAVCDIPWTIPLDYRRELVAHSYIVAPPYAQSDVEVSAV